MTAVFTDANHLCCFSQILIKYLLLKESGSVKYIHMVMFSHPPLPECNINFVLLNIYMLSKPQADEITIKYY